MLVPDTQHNVEHFLPVLCVSVKFLSFLYKSKVSEKTAATALVPRICSTSGSSPLILSLSVSKSELLISLDYILARLNFPNSVYLYSWLQHA